jgi:hypothetical protein
MWFVILIFIFVYLNGDEVSPTHLPRSTPHEHYFSPSGTHFCWRLSKLQGLVRLEGLGKLGGGGGRKKNKSFTSSGLCDLPVIIIMIIIGWMNAKIVETTCRKQVFDEHTYSLREFTELISNSCKTCVPHG